LPDEWKESNTVTICKKGYKTDSSNYRRISLLPNTFIQHPSVKVSFISRGNYWGSSSIFRRNMSTTDHIFCNRNILQNKWEYNGAVYRLLLDFNKSYEPVRREVLYKIPISCLHVTGKTNINVSIRQYIRARVGKRLLACFLNGL
jgi:hypothetical protein